MQSKLVRFFCQTKYCPKQFATFKDPLILVDYSDKEQGQIAKDKAHYSSYIKDGLPHRAFSLFLFNAKNELLFQQRSQTKITFPLMWTNSVCSHPNWGKTESMVEQVRYRSLLEVNADFHEPLLVKKVLYKSFQCEQWGEFELDYIYFAQIREDSLMFYQKDNSFNVNEEEVNKVEFVGLEEVKDFMLAKEREGQGFTPWFKGVWDQGLEKEWKLWGNKELKGYKDGDNIDWLKQY